MDERTTESIKRHLQSKAAQERIEQYQQRGRLEATVTIGRVAQLFNIKENKLRDLEDRGLLRPMRSKDGTTGQRQYSPTELDKLAIIKELIDEGYTPVEIPQNIEGIWYETSPAVGKRTSTFDETEYLPIDLRVKNARIEFFWRFFASHALRMALMLIREDIPDTTMGLVLPLDFKGTTISVRGVEDLPRAGESLVGWLGRSRSSYTFLTAAPSFQFSTDYRILPLQGMKEDEVEEDSPKDNTLLLLERRARPLTLSMPVVETIRRLLRPLYEEALNLRTSFGRGMRDELDPAPDLDSSINYRDMILDGLADMVVRLGGQAENGQNHWRFCCMLLPKDSSLPLQQRTFVVRAQSKQSPHKVGVSAVYPEKSMNSLSLRAYQSGHVIYRTKISPTDSTIAHREVEGPIKSALAVPIGGENGPVVAVLYITSDEIEAFTESDQRVLRMIGRMAEEAISTYRARQQVTGRLTSAIERPRSVDPLFEDFLSENDFVHDVEDLLITLKAEIPEWKEPKPKKEISPDEREAQYRAGQLSGEVVSFIAIDIDNQSSLATQYGDQVARNLSKMVGLRIQGQLHLFANPEHRRLYHINADRFYIMLKGMPLDEALNRAEFLRITLGGDYRVEARSFFEERPMLPERMLELPKVTVRLGVPSYTYGKLKEILPRYPTETAIADARALIMQAFDEILNLGQKEGGNVVISLDPKNWRYIRWSPATST